MTLTRPRLIGQCLAPCLAFCGTLAYPVTAEPPLAEQAYDFGIVDRGTIVRHTFVVVNTTGVVWQIASEKVSCGACVSVHREWTELPPGESGDVEVRLDTKGKRGRLNQWAALVPTDDRCATIRLAMRGAVHSVWLDPTNLDLGRLQPGEVRDIPYAVRVVGMKEARLRALESSNPAVMALALEKPTARTSEDARVETLAIGKLKWTTPTDVLGAVRYSMRATITYNGRVLELVAQISGHVVGSIDASPRGVFFGRVASGETVERTLLLRASGGKRIQWDQLVLSAEHDSVQCSFLAVVDDGARVVARVVGPEAQESGVIRGVIVGSIGDDILCAIPYTLLMHSSHE